MGNKTSFVYNPLGLVCEMVKSSTKGDMVDSEVETANPIEGTVGGETVRYNYYPGGRLKSIALSSGEHEYYSYDSRGNMVSITKTMNTDSYTITLQYDPLNRLTKAIHPLGYESVFEYDAVGRITRAVSHLGEGWYSGMFVDSLDQANPSKSNRPYDLESFGVRYKTGNNNPNPQGQNPIPFTPSSITGHGFMTEDMVIEDGEGRGFEPKPMAGSGRSTFEVLTGQDDRGFPEGVYDGTTLSLRAMMAAIPNINIVSTPGHTIRNNSQHILDAAEHFGVSPNALAAIIYAEHYLNVNWIDVATDYPLSFLDFLDWEMLSPSVGIAQVKVSTARFVEDMGLMPRIETNYTWWQYLIFWEEASEGKTRARALLDPRTNIMYAAAYLRIHQDRWSPTYPNIVNNVGVLATLYNLGFNNTHPHSNPNVGDFGRYVLQFYWRMPPLLGLNRECE